VGDSIGMQGKITSQESRIEKLRSGKRPWPDLKWQFDAEIRNRELLRQERKKRVQKKEKLNYRSRKCGSITQKGSACRQLDGQW